MIESYSILIVQFVYKSVKDVLVEDLKKFFEDVMVQYSNDDEKLFRSVEIECLYYWLEKLLKAFHQHHHV
jgi:hypothetical protein